MLSNMEATDDLRGLARARARLTYSKTVRLASADALLTQGWIMERKTRKSAHLRKDKDQTTLLRDKIWSILSRTGFLYLSGEDGASLELDPKDAAGPSVNLSIVGVDAEVALAAECVSDNCNDFDDRLSATVNKLSSIRRQFAAAINQQYPAQFKRQIGVAIFVPDDCLSEQSRQYADNAGVVILEERDLKYYGELVEHLGNAAKYQLLADILPGKSIAGLNITVPAIRTKMGPYTCYSFSLSPEYLLKIAYVSHRAKGTASDVGSYQRMIKKARLKTIRKYLDEENSLFPTNIVTNIDKKRLTFERRPQDPDSQSGVLGWLRIRAAYKSAWIIDGQHRLFAYSGHAKANSAHLSVLAFESLPPEIQANLFIDINAKQKSVKQSHLQELYSIFHWTAVAEKDRVSAIVSRAIHVLNTDRRSPFYGRITSSDEVSKDPLHCITLPSFFGPLATRSDLYVRTSKVGSSDANNSYGPLWVEGDTEATLQRTVFVLKGWFNTIREAAPEWWDAGKAEGGGLAMSDSVTSLILVLKSVFHHLSPQWSISTLSNAAIMERLQPFAAAVGEYLASMSDEDRKKWRALRGVQGHTARMRQCQRYLNERFSDFEPEGLAEYIQEEKAETNKRAKEITDHIEVTLQRTVIEELKREFGPDDTQWWMEGIPSGIRKKVSTTYEDDKGARGGKECYFDLLDYRNVIMNNWSVLGGLLGYGRTSASKEKRTAWINDVNERRKITAHPSSGKTVSLDQLAQLEEYAKWLEGQISGRLDSDPEDSL